MSKRIAAILLVITMLGLVACGAEEKGHYLHSKAADEIDFGEDPVK